MNPYIRCPYRDTFGRCRRVKCSDAKAQQLCPIDKVD